MKGLIIILLFIMSLPIFAQPVEVIIGTDTTNSWNGPINRYYNYSAHEAIYLRSEISISGNITSIAYYKHSGLRVDPIAGTTIYMKHTEDSVLVTGNYSLVGYSEVFAGLFTNNAQQGWMEIQLTTPFQYNNINNLGILVLNGYMYNWGNFAPKYRYTTTSPVYRTRQAASDASQPTNLIQTYNRPNIKLTIFPTSSVTEHNFTNHLIINEFSAKPNPFTNKTNISFNLAQPQKVSLKIYDASGKLVMTLVNGLMSSGIHNFIWNGTDEHSNNVEEGIYFYTLETPKHNYSRKLVLIRQ
ncbi:MAG: FlgD immunoglobulin-like domain containing protein [candidate division WOR-3 bacterium]